jgi:pimeloyl-ACP methyl ester carboxylesterase
MKCIVIFVSFYSIVFVAVSQDFPKPTGKLVDIGGYKLHLVCEGKGSQTVVFISGSGDFSFDWTLVTNETKKKLRVCSYDRSGLAWSDLGPVPRTMRQDVFELHILLQKANVKGPFILVGHSIGGLLARLYAQKYPDNVFGIILLDSTTDDTELFFQGKITSIRESAVGKTVPDPRTLKDGYPQPPTDEDVKQAQFNREVFGAPKIDPPFDKLPAEIQKIRLWALNNEKMYAKGDDFWAEELNEMYEERRHGQYLLGNTPLLIIIPTREMERPGNIPEEEWKKYLENKRQKKLNLATLSSNSKIIFADKSGHHVQLDQPELVVAAIEDLCMRLKTNKKFSD